MKEKFMGIFVGILIENTLLFATKGCAIQNIIHKTMQSENVTATTGEAAMSTDILSNEESISTIDHSLSTTEAHSHKWEAITNIIHHDAVTNQVWKEDMPSWDETIETKKAWDEQVIAQEAWDETVLLQDEYDEPIYEWIPICNVCNHQFPTGTTVDQLEYHIFDDPGCGGGWHDVQVQTGSIHHNAIYQVIHHDAIYQAIHHDAETLIIHHEAVGHYEIIMIQDAWDETVVTGYRCSDCGETSTM